MDTDRQASKRTTAMAACVLSLVVMTPAVAQVGGPGTVYGTPGPGSAYNRGHYPTVPAVPNGVPRVAPNVVLGWGGLPPPQYGGAYAPPPVYGPIGPQYPGAGGWVQGVPVAPGTLPGTVQVIPLQPAPYDPWAPR